jgi:hypothetical protein
MEKKKTTKKMQTQNQPTAIAMQKQERHNNICFISKRGYSSCTAVFKSSQHVQFQLCNQ